MTKTVKTKVKAAPRQKQSKWMQLFIPSIIGAFIAWFFSGGSVDMTIIVFIAVLVGNWIGYSMLHKK